MACRFGRRVSGAYQRRVGASRNEAGTGWQGQGVKSQASNIGQTLAARIRSNQTRFAKIEAGDPSVSLELLVRAALAAGGSKREVAKALC
jgi:hypothetical protein